MSLENVKLRNYKQNISKLNEQYKEEKVMVE